MSPSTVAAFDCGTNSIKVLVGSARPGGGMDVVLRESRVVRLGQGVDRTGELAPEALERTFAANPAPALINRLSDLRFIKVNQGFWR